MIRHLQHIKNWPELARQAQWSAKLLAQKCNVSTRTLERFFHETIGKCPHAWLAGLRQQEAIELLRDGSSVKETASLVGYRHTSTFAREFKKHNGQSPNELAKAQAQLGRS